MLGKDILNFRMPGDRLSLAVVRIKINIMSRTMSIQNAASFCQLPQELLALHTVISLMRKFEGISSNVI